MICRGTLKRVLYITLKQLQKHEYCIKWESFSSDLTIKVQVEDKCFRRYCVKYRGSCTWMTSPWSWSSLFRTWKFCGLVVWFLGKCQTKTPERFLCRPNFAWMEPQGKVPSHFHVPFNLSALRRIPAVTCFSHEFMESRHSCGDFEKNIVDDCSQISWRIQWIHAP